MIVLQNDMSHQKPDFLLFTWLLSLASSMEFSWKQRIGNNQRAECLSMSPAKKATLKVKIIETQKHKQFYARRGDHLVWNQSFKLSWVLSISSQDDSITFLGK